MNSPSEHQLPQPTISGYNVEDGRSFLPDEDMAPLEHSSTGLSRDDSQFADDDDHAHGTDSESPGLSLDEALRAEMLDDEVKRGEYMPLDVLRSIMTRERVVGELEAHYEADQVKRYAGLICPEKAETQAHALRVETCAYTKVFAILTLLNKCEEIHRFVSERLSDEKLPFRRGDGTARIRSKFRLFVNENSVEEIQACKDWAPRERDTFLGYQRKFLVHFFTKRPDRDEPTFVGVKEPSRKWVDEVAGTTYIPWTQKKLSPVWVGGAPVLGSSMSSSSAAGAYSSVTPFYIGDNDHNFATLLDNVGNILLLCMCAGTVS